MSTESISNGSATINGAFENESTNSLPRSESQPRFRISKPPTYEDMIDAGIPGDDISPSTPSAQPKNHAQNGKLVMVII